MTNNPHNSNKVINSMNKYCVHVGILCNKCTHLGVPSLLASLEKEKNSRIVAEKEKSELEKRLSESLTKVLSGYVTICAKCKYIKNKEGNWEKVEFYVEKHSDAKFSHGICPECTHKLYPDLPDD